MVEKLHKMVVLVPTFYNLCWANIEAFIKREVENGRSTIGLYPTGDGIRELSRGPLSARPL